MDRAREGGRQTNGRKKESNTHKKNLEKKKERGRNIKEPGTIFLCHSPHIHSIVLLLGEVL